MSRKHVCVLSLALPIETDPRSGRQVDALLTTYDVTLIGFGKPPNHPHLAWRDVNLHTPRWRRLYEMLLLVLGRLIPYFYEVYFWTRPRYRQCLRYALEARADAYHASDWAMLPIAVRAAKAHNAKVVFDIDEYWILFDETNRQWMRFFSPLIRYVFKKYSRYVDGAITVSQPFVERYKEEFNLDCLLLVNAPPYQVAASHAMNPTQIRLIHHGAAVRDRHTEVFIQALPLLEPRFILELLLIPTDRSFVQEMREMADQTARDRVHFRDAVSFNEVVQAISDCDIEVALIPPATYHYYTTLPNKIFESMMAGLAVLVGPSPAMAQIVRETGAGWVTNGFAPEDIAAALNALTIEQIEAARLNALEAAKVYNAEAEAAKLRDLYQGLWASPSNTAESV